MLTPSYGQRHTVEGTDLEF